MKLLTVHVTNFRSVENSEKFEVGPVTCLVGKNEAGKSAILLALAALNPHAATPTILDKERDYPRRHLTQYDEKHVDQDALAITTTWELKNIELEAIESEVGGGVIKSNTVTVSRCYNQKAKVSAELDFNAALKFLYSKFALSAPERSVFSSVSTTYQLITALSKLDSPTQKHHKLRDYLNEHGTLTKQLQELIFQMLPRFMYFSSYDRMEGAIQLEQTNSLIKSNEIEHDKYRGTRLFSEFLDYAGVSINEITNVTTYETFNAKLQAASNNITDQILEYWTQNPDLNVIVRVEQARPDDPAPLNQGTIARARIDNSLHRVDTPFSERSAGFVWFFSFLVKFAQVKDESSSVILLLDEPGLSLHGKAQADLLRFFKEKLAPHHQIVYSTHSPFMVPADNLASVRIVQDQVELKGQRRVPIGTKVRDDVLARDPDTLFPLQGALGYEISQSLFIGENTLLVEGPSDILYIQALSDALRRRNRTSLDTRWILCPAGSIDSIKPFIALFAGNALHVAVLSDQARGNKRKIEAMKKSEVLSVGHFYTIADFLDRTEADIEDIFHPEVFVTILNDCYELKEPDRLTVDKLKAADTATTRLVKQAEAAFRVMPDTIPMFDHFAPAAWLIRNLNLLEKDSISIRWTLDSAEKIFKIYNKLLS